MTPTYSFNKGEEIPTCKNCKSILANCGCCFNHECKNFGGY